MLAAHDVASTLTPSELEERFLALCRSFEHDRRRDQQLMLAGWRVVRFTARRLGAAPEAAAATMRDLLARC